MGCFCPRILFWIGCLELLQLTMSVTGLVIHALCLVLYHSILVAILQIFPCNHRSY